MSADAILSSVAGGLVIGIAVSLFHLSIGRIAGISGILGGALTRRPELWRVAFLAGLPLGGLLYAVAAGGFPVVEVRLSSPWLAAAGLLVGYGTQLGGGCTSGHGICGIARGSIRSIVATLVFMASAMVTVFVVGRITS